ncbi:hypothetical protein G6F15_013507 [Rhizopus arrhizus]|nr:hypothetical protein G6F20_013422 [Rhizopus arrhizus]KAG0862527.1 hypothetical protein G6F15_013507 [Rhizopus arrhizus]KAG1149008.1 hypothetical protein G6F36_014759 [Rhizopus arrhizus]
MTANNLILWNERLAYGQPTSYTFQGTSIIDFFFSTAELEMPTLRIHDDLSLNSNHKSMTMTFYLPPHPQGPTNLPRPQRISWNIGKLKHLKSRDTLASLDSVCGRRSPQADEYLKDFWTDEMTAAFNRREYYYKKWRKACGLNCFQYWLQHQEVQAALRRLVTRRLEFEKIGQLNRLFRPLKARNIQQVPWPIIWKRYLLVSYSQIELIPIRLHYQALHLMTQLHFHLM